MKKKKELEIKSEKSEETKGATNEIAKETEKAEKNGEEKGVINIEEQDNEKKNLEKEVIAEEKEGKNNKRFKRIVIWFAVGAVGIFLILAVIYFVTSVYYKSHFLPNLFINNIECSNMNVEELTSIIDSHYVSNEYIVYGRNPYTGESGFQIGVIKPEDIDMKLVNPSDRVKSKLDEQNHWTWITALLGNKTEETIDLEKTYNELLLKDHIMSWESCITPNTINPVNAYISPYDENEHVYKIVPETIGTKLNLKKVEETIKEHIDLEVQEIDLEKNDCYLTADKTSNDYFLNSEVNKANRWLSSIIRYDWNENPVILDASTICEWVSFENEKAILDEGEIYNFVKENAKKYDTYGKTKSFTTYLGVDLELKSPNYGWKTDVDLETNELTALIHQGSQCEREPIYSIEAKKKGKNDIGDSYIEADLTHQHLYVYEKGEVVFETDFVSGSFALTPDCVTPEGIFGLSYKTRDAVLRGANYATPVKYWMPFYGNYGMHDARWRTSFGGTIYRLNGSHGCINLPLSAAEIIYGYVSKSSPVICYYYKVDPINGEPTDMSLVTGQGEEIDENQIPEESPQVEQDMIITEGQDSE